MPALLSRSLARLIGLAVLLILAASAFASKTPGGDLYFAKSYFAGGQRGWLFWLAPSHGLGTMYRPGMAGPTMLRVAAIKSQALSFRSIKQRGSAGYSFLGRAIGDGWFEGGIASTGGAPGSGFAVVMREIGAVLDGTGTRSGLYSSRESVPEAGDLVGNDLVLVRAKRGNFVLWESYQGVPSIPLAGSDVKLNGPRISFRVRTDRGDLFFDGSFTGKGLKLACTSELPLGACPSQRTLALTWREDVQQLMKIPAAGAEPRSAARH